MRQTALEVQQSDKSREDFNLSANPPKLFFKSNSFKLTLLALDIIGLSLSLTAIYFLKGEGPLSLGPQLLFVSIFTLVNLTSLYIFDVYKIDLTVIGLRAPGRVLLSCLTSGIIITLCIYALRLQENAIASRSALIFAMLGFAVWAIVCRLTAGSWLQSHCEKYHWLAFGKSDHLENLLAEFKKNPEQGQVVPVDISEANTSRWDEFEQLSQHQWSGIIVSAKEEFPDPVVDKLLSIRGKGTPVYELSDFYEQFYSKVPVDYVEKSWLAFSNGFVLIQYPIWVRIKNVLDVVVAGLFLAATFPLILISCLIVKLGSPGPAIFSQTRIGKNGSEFLVYKIRTMRNDAEKDGAVWAKKNDNRVTPFGRFLRSSRIDELPQLWNVIRGDMSFIGPRPERPEFQKLLEENIPHYNLRHLVKPGITGWAQVMYNYGASVDDAKEKLQYELFYIKNYSLILDAAILFKTVRMVLFGRGR